MFFFLLFYAVQCHIELGSPINLLNCKLVETSRCLEADLTMAGFDTS